MLCLGSVGMNAMEQSAPKILELTKENVLLLESFPNIIVIDCFGDQCPPCKLMAPIFEQVAQELGAEYLFAKINTEKEGEFAQKFEIRAVPTFLVIKTGKVLGRLIGFMPKEKFFEKLKDIIQGPLDLTQLTKAQLNERLIDAAKLGDIKEMKRFLEAGAEINKDASDKDTLQLVFFALMNIGRLAEESSLEGIKMLLDAGIPLEYSFPESPEVIKIGENARQMAERFKKISILYERAETLIKEREERLKSVSADYAK